jgi:nicotinamide-nucleotide amidase
MKRAAIISTGSELMHGAVQDGNSFFISSLLFRTDINVSMFITVGDVIDDIKRALSDAMSYSDIIFITGGLGPTEDDLTVRAVTEMFTIGTYIYENGFNRMNAFFASMGTVRKDCDIKMVTIPVGSLPFHNEVGLAAGFSLVVNGKLIIAMPGVPREMRYMFTNHVLPYLKESYEINEKKHLVFRTVLIREAEANNMVKSLDIPADDAEWGITAVPGANVITFVQKNGREFPEEKIIREMSKVFGGKILDHESIEEEVVRLLIDKNITLSAAESCTGGLLSERITSIPGASGAFRGGVIAYSNESKIILLDVSDESLRKYGAVSEHVAGEMAAGAAKRLKSDMAAAITGIAGPDGGTPEKPVGTVCFGLYAGNTLSVWTRNIAGDRERIRFIASQEALSRIRSYLKGK